MRRDRDDAHVAVAVPARLVVRTDRHEARILAARARVAVLQALEVAQHRVLVVVRVEHGVRHELRRARKRTDAARDARRERRCAEARRLAAGQHREQRVDVRKLGRLVDRDADRRGAHVAQVDACSARCGVHRRRVLHSDRDRVEERRVSNAQAKLLGALCEHAREAVDAARDAQQALWAVVHSVQRADVGEQRLRRADVGRGLVAADVLLARLHRHAQRRLPRRVDAAPDDAAWHHALVVLGARQERGVWAAVAERHAETLRRADDNVGAPLAWRAQHRQRQQVRRHAHLNIGCMRLLDHVGIVPDRAIARGVLQQHTTHVGRVVHLVLLHNLRNEAQAVGARLHHCDRLRVALALRKMG
eukprot:258863-Chlamydomonas_euryale.AAC.4